MASGPAPSEAEFLKREAEKAKVALTASLKNAKEALIHVADPTAAARRHPIITIVSAAVVGFAATVIAIPSREELEMRRMERMHRAMHPEPTAGQAGSSANGHSPPKPSLGGVVLKELIAFAKPILLALITAKVKAEAAASPPPDFPAEREPSAANPPE